MKRVLVKIALLFLYFVVPIFVFGQSHQNDTAKDQKSLEKAADEGIKLPSRSVHQSVRVEAVLLPYPVANRIFGKEIANTYAVIELTISNKSADAAFILHGAFIDYSHWGLSGLDGVDIKEASAVGNNDPDQQTQSSSNTAQVASAEYRIARGQLLDAQQWTARNWTMRLLTLGGSLASGYSFAFKETGIAKGIAAFNGNFVPGMAVAWPDGTVSQLNRISDFGYQTNKLIPKQGADIIVCFFPIDRFLTSGFKELFKHSPALFFAPLQMLEDKKMEGRLLRYLPIHKRELGRARYLLPCYIRVQHPTDQEAHASTAEVPLRSSLDKEEDEDCRQTLLLNGATGADGGNDQDQVKLTKKALHILDFIERMSLNNVRVVVDGIMSVDTNLVPAKIELVTFDQDDKSPSFWAATGDKAGTIKGEYLGGGEVSIVDSDKLGITDLKTVSSGSDEHNLKFSFKLTKPIETGTKLTFKVTKKNNDKTGAGKNAESMTYDYVVGYTETPPRVSKVETKDKTVTVSGAGFFDTATNPLKVSLRPQGQATDSKDIVVKPTSQSEKQIVFDVPASVAAGCYSVVVKINTMQAPVPATLVPVPAAQSCK